MGEDRFVDLGRARDHHTHDQAVITTVILERSTTQSAPLAEIQVRAEEPAARPAEEISEAAELLRPARQLDSEPPPVASLAPDRPRRELDELLDDVLFSERCLNQYQRRYGKEVGRRAASDHLRNEIRLRGYLMQGQDGEYSRIRVPRKFDVVLPSRPAPDAPIRVDGLYFPRTTARRGGRRGTRKVRQP